MISCRLPQMEVIDRLTRSDRHPQATRSNKETNANRLAMPTRHSARIVLVVPTFPKLSETFICNKFVRLVEAGFDVRIACSTFDDRAWRMFDVLRENPALRRRIHVTRASANRGLAVLLAPLALSLVLLRNPGSLLRLWKRFGIGAARRAYLHAHVLSTRADILHVEFGTLARDFGYLREMLPCRLVVSFRGFDLNFAGLDIDSFYSTVWKTADAIHVLGEDLRLRAIKRGCPPQMRTALIPPAIDAKAFALDRNDFPVTGTTERPLRIVSVGRLEWKKGYEHSLMCIRHLIDRGVVTEYRIIGTGEYFEAVNFCRQQLGLKDAVALLGAMPPESVREQMAWADVLLHTAVSEGFCNAVIEAQAMKLPVVCSDADGLSENVEHEHTGFVVGRRDTNGFADRLEQLAHDGELRRRMGVAGRERVLTRYQLDGQVQAFAELYSSISASEMTAK